MNNICCCFRNLPIELKPSLVPPVLWYLYFCNPGHRIRYPIGVRVKISKYFLHVLTKSFLIGVSSFALKILYTIEFLETSRLTTSTHIYQIKPVKPNLSSQIYQTKPSKQCLPNKTNSTEPNLQNQTYQTIPTKPNQNFQRNKSQAPKLNSCAKSAYPNVNQSQTSSSLH